MSITSVNNTNVENSNVSQVGDNRDKSAKTEESDDKASAEASAKISQYYSSLTKYSAPSMDNICEMMNNNISESSIFYNKHIGFCNVYGDAATKYGDCKTSKDFKDYIENVKNATETAVNGLKNLIVDEKQVLNEHKSKSFSINNLFGNNSFNLFNNSFNNNGFNSNLMNNFSSVLSNNQSGDLTTNMVGSLMNMFRGFFS